MAAVVGLVPGCVVAFNDYPLGDLDGEAGGGAGGKDSSSAGSSNHGGVGNDPAPSMSGSGSNAGSGAVSGSDAVGGSGTAGSGAVAGSGGVASGGTGDSGGGGSGGSGGVPLGDFAGMGGEGGAPIAEPVTVAIMSVDDTYLSSSSRNSNYGNEKSLIIDRNVGGDTHDSLIRAALDVIPAAAQISAATLTLSCSRIGDPINVSYIETAWQELTVRSYNAPTVGELLTSVGPNPTGALIIDVKQAVVAWVTGAHDNYGLYLSLPGMMATECASSEALDETTRPRLSVTYTLP